ncbi:MAG: FAD-binding protein, partial [Firmicutes bacterium]|nr:FAD-binding protein [Bacillota bacterium]
MTPQPSDIELHQILLELSQASPRAAGLRPWGHHEGPTLDMSAWSYIRQYDPEDLVMTVGAGTRLSTVSETLARESQWLPLNVPDGGDDSIGGAVATQLDGWYRGGYGPFRDRVLGLRVVTPAFGPIFVGSRVVKNVAGFNLPRLFAGTRGSLGVITEVTLRVSPRPPVEALWVHPIAPGEYAHTLDALSEIG